MFSTLTLSFAQIVMVAHLVLGVFGGLAVYSDAIKREKLVFDLHPIWWGATAVAGSLLGVTAYWIVHYSSLATAGSQRN